MDGQTESHVMSLAIALTFVANGFWVMSRPAVNPGSAKAHLMDGWGKGRVKDNGKLLKIV